MRRSTSGSRVRGITPSITMYAGATRPLGAPGGLAPLPEELALCLVLRKPDLPRAVLPAGGADTLGLLVEARGPPVSSMRSTAAASRG